jgi:hypothetical protein
MSQDSPSFNSLSAREEMAVKFQRVSAELDAAGAAAAARRLAEAAALVSDGSFEDLEKFIDPGRTIDEAATAVRRHRRYAVGAFLRSVRGARLARSIAVVLPFLFTGIALAIAASSYSGELRAHPNLTNQSFLFLWQQGFGSSSLSLTWVAVTNSRR